MASHVALPREGYLEMLYRIFAHLKKHRNVEMGFDPSKPSIKNNVFERKDWSCSEFSSTIKKECELHPRTHAPRGMGFAVVGKVDVDHDGDTVVRRSRTGFIVHLNSALVCLYSKKQNSVEASSFGSKFIAMKQLCDCIQGLAYKLRMMGIAHEGRTCLCGGNQSMLVNTTTTDFTLKKKSSSLAYHFIREGVAIDDWRTAYVNANDNETNLLTKILPFGEKRRKFVRKELMHIYGSC